MTDINLFEKYGGFFAIQGLINAFYDEVLASDLVAYMFEGLNIPALIDHQTQYVSMLLGAEVTFDEQRLVAAHKNLNITEKEWDEVVRIFIKTLHEFNIEAEDIDTIVGVVASKKPLIVF